MPTYYVDNEQVTPKFNFSRKNIREFVDYDKYWTVQVFDQIINLIVGIIQTEDVSDTKTGEFAPNILAEQLLDMSQFEAVNNACDIELIDELVFIIADELGIV